MQIIFAFEGACFSYTNFLFIFFILDTLIAINNGLFTKMIKYKITGKK